MANITMDSLKIALQSVLAAVTRHKPNLTVTNPDDPRFVVGAEEMRENVSKAQETADEAKENADRAQETADKVQESADRAQETADKAKESADRAQETADKAKESADRAQATATDAQSIAAEAKETAEAIRAAGADWNQDDSTALDYIKNRTHYTVPSTVLSGFTNKLTDGTFDGSSCIVIGDAFDAKKLIGAKIRYAGDEVILTENQIYPLAGSYTNVAIAVSSPQSKELPGLFVINGAPTNGTFVTDSGTKAYQFGRTGLYRMDGFYTVPGSLEIEYGGEVVPLDEKYLPASVTESIATVQEIAEEAKSAADEAKATADAKMDATNPTGSGALSIGRAEGTTVGDNSSAVGNNVTASGANAHAEGDGLLEKYKITGDASATTYKVYRYILSEDIPAAPNSAVMVGKYIKCGGVVALITKCNGTDSTITTSQTLSETALDGVAAIVFSDASGASSHVEGDRTTASGKSAHAEGSNTQAKGATAHAEGTSSVASGANAHAEGVQTAAVGYASHAEGNNTKANGSGSHAQGCLTKAEGQYTHASGSQTTAVGYAQSVFGLANVEDTLTTTKAHPLDSGSLKSHYLIVVGNGTLSNYGTVKKRSNAHTLDWDGNAWFAGSVEGTAAILKSTTEGSEKCITITADDNLRLTATDEDGNTRTFGTGYELIETITLDEDMAIVRTEEPDGTPYNFTAVAIRTKKAEGITLGETYLTAHIGESKTQPLYMPQTSSTTEQWTYCEVYQYRGLWERERAQGWSVKNNAELPYQVKLPSFDNPVVEGENIVKISGASVPAGLTIEIWGERA